MDEELNLKLQPLRDRIDSLDARLLTLLNERATVVLEVGEVKKDLSAPVFRPERERQVIERLQALGAQGPLRGEHILAIWREIMSASRALERELTIAYLGPVGTYSELAMHGVFGLSVKSLPCASIDEVFRAVEAGSADYGVVPVENSTEGAVSRSLDLMLDTTLNVSGEIAVPIHHNLLTRSGKLDGVKRVCAHAQALAQCQGWLSKHAPTLERQAVSSNAEAARLAAEDPTLAAIAGDRAAAHYGLQAVASLIQDDPHNRTRFLVVGGDSPEPTGRDQTTMILSVKNEPGALFRLLEPFARHGVSMTRFESRPARRGAWEYWFYVDIEGHVADEHVAQALDEINQSAAFVKILGSYPRSH